MSAGNFDPAAYPIQRFDDAEWQVFCASAAVLGLPAFERERAEALYSHLASVNSWMNLTRLQSPADFLRQHLLDSLTVLRLPELQDLDPDRYCIDLGAGGGYPGLPLAACCHVPWVLIDSRGKKVRFLEAASALTGNPDCSARQFRGREAPVAAPDLLLSCQLAVTRAAGQTARILEECAPMLAPDAGMVLYKGPQYEGDEHQQALKAAKQFHFRFDRIERLRLDSDDHERLLVVFHRSSTVPDQY